MSRRGRTPFIALLLMTALGAILAGPEEPAPTPESAPVRQVVGTITGTVYEVLKKPMAGCMVQLTSRGQDSVLRVTGTDEKGHYVFKDLPAGTYDIEVGAAGAAVHTKEKIEVRPPFRNIVDFEMASKGTAPGQKGPPDSSLSEALKKAIARQPETAAAEPAATVEVRGTFVDAQKRPLAEISIMLLSLEEKGSFQTFSSVEGTFSLPAVPPGRYRVLVLAPGYVSIDLKNVLVAPTSGLNLSLSLVDYPLTFKGRTEDHLPAEEPVRQPAQGL